MGMLWVVLFVALTGSHFGYGLPIGPTPQTYPYDGSELESEEWGRGGLYAAVPALALLVTAVGLLFGCTWCYKHKDCKLFTGSVTQHLHDARRSNPPDSGFSEPANNNISEDNNNGPISLREMQNIANNNAAAYIVSENEERNRVSRESVVEFEPLPAGIGAADPLERYADWFGGEDFSRNRLQYLREIGRGWFGRVVEGELEDHGATSSVAVKILNQNATLEDKARFLEEARVYRDVSHESVLRFVDKCLMEDPWILIFEFCSMDLQQYLIVNRHKMASLNDSGVPLQLMCDVSSALAHLHSRGYIYGCVWPGSVLVRGARAEAARAVLGRYARAAPPYDPRAPDQRDQPDVETTSTDVWSLGTLVWQVCTWGMTPPRHPPPLPDLPCPYRSHLYQVMQLCWHPHAEARPTAGEVHALLSHLRAAHAARGGGAGPDARFEQRWQRLKPNTIPVVDEHRALVHAPGEETRQHEQEFDNPPTIQDTLSVDMDTAVSRSSSIMSDKDPLSAQIKSESLTNLHGSLEDVRNIYLTHRETAALECHQGNISLEDAREKEQDRSDSSMDPWLKDIIAGSQDDVSYYKDVSDVIKNLDNILNSEKTSSSESSHQASPSRDNLSLDCKKDYPMQSSMVKSPGISNFQNILDSGFIAKSPELAACEEDEGDRDTLGTLSHSFERHSDTISQQTLENITPETPVKDLDMEFNIEDQVSSVNEDLDKSDKVSEIEQDTSLPINTELPNEHKIVNSDSKIPKLKELCVASIPSVSETNFELSNGTQDCLRSCDSKLAQERTDNEIETKSIDEVVKENADFTPVKEHTEYDAIKFKTQVLDDEALILPKSALEATNTLMELPSVSESMILAERKSEEDNMLTKDSPKTSRNLKCDDISAPIVISDLILPVETITDSTHETVIEDDCSKNTLEDMTRTVNNIEFISIAHSKAPETVQNIVHNDENDSTIQNEKSEEILVPALEQMLHLSPDTVQTIDNELIHDETRLQNVDAPSEDDTTSPRNETTDHYEARLQSDDAPNITDKTFCINKTPDHDEMEVKMTDLPTYEITVPPKSNTPVEEIKMDVSDVVESYNTVLTTNDTLVSDEMKSQSGDASKVALTSSAMESFDHEASLPNSCDKVETKTPTKNELLVDEEMRVMIADALQCEDMVSPKLENKVIQDEKTIEQSNDSTVYMHLVNTTSNTAKDETMDEELKSVIKSCLDVTTAENSPCTLVKNESTVYMDLPSMINETDNFLQNERILSSQNDQIKEICSSTPIGSDNENSVKANEAETFDVKPNENEMLCENKAPVYAPGVTLTKLEQRYVPESMSPFESPTKSHHTDTYDENSSVVLGPFENCTLELFKGAKSLEPVDLPREELLALSSNFSEMNLETPSPLRDGNFLNEVPDIMHDDIQFDDLETLSEQLSKSGGQTEDSNETEKAGTEKRVSPLTPPNSPGNFLASTSQAKYSVVDIDLDAPMGPSTSEVDSGLPKEVDLNQIELQITTKLAMAENENNMNIEYSGPLTVEGVVLDETVLLHESEDGLGAVEESYLAGNGGSPRASVELDEECVKALRNELELKLPLAQVASIEPPAPAGAAEWDGAPPPPPELVLSYPGALSPIPEETRHQLSAYENDANWNISTRTDSSESYPEPCNNSTDEVTDLPTGLASARADTYTLCRDPRDPPDHPDHPGHPGHPDHPDAPGAREPSPDRTYTLQRDNTSKEVTMSADSLNGSPYKKPAASSPVDDRTYNKHDEEREAGCERLSQVSPFILSPESAPSDLERASTLSRPTLPTDAKSSKPSETHCLSKATSIDSWCSNDTLYNVEENFDDLALDPDAYDDDSDSGRTLTHHDERDLSRCSTYIVHDTRSEPCDTFSPDSINDNCTYTKPQTAAALTGSDSTKNTQTKDLAYGTLMSGMPSYSNCTTEVASALDDAWRMQPELVRRSPAPPERMTPPRLPEPLDLPAHPHPLTPQPVLNKMDSVEITCFHDDSAAPDRSPDDNTGALLEADSPAPDAALVTSTPLTAPPAGADAEAILMQLPRADSLTPDSNVVSNVPNFQSFFQSAEMRPQDISPEASPRDAEVLLDGDSRTLSRAGSGLAAADHTPNYSDFESSAVSKPQDLQSQDGSARGAESGDGSDEFRHFESSVRCRPQDLSSVIDASSSLLHSERRFSESVDGAAARPEQTSQSESRVNDHEQKSLDVSPPNDTNLIESQVDKVETPSGYYVDEVEEETEQPHSIIMTEREVLKETPNRTYDSHKEAKDLNHTYDSHTNRQTLENNDSHNRNMVQVNGIDSNAVESGKSPTVDDLFAFLDDKSPKEEVRETVSPVAVTEAVANKSDANVVNDVEEIKCNGNSEKYATVQFLNETFEELIESNVDDGDCKGDDLTEETPNGVETKSPESSVPVSPVKEPTGDSEETTSPSPVQSEDTEEVKTNGVQESEKMTSVTESFLQNEKNFCQLDSFFPLLSDIRFTGPAAEIMSTSFTEDSPTEPASPECERDGKPDAAADILKEWDSDTDSHSTNSSSGEFIWKDGHGRETPLVPSTRFQHQRGANGAGPADAGARDGASSGSGSGSGSEGDEVEFVPSSWDCRAAPAKSSLRSLEATPDSKKRVVFKRQKYHCVYEYPREAAAVDASPAAYVPDLSTYAEWDRGSAEEAELGYGQLFGAPSPLDLYPLRAGIGYDYDEDFFISSSARPFESLGIMSTTSQFFPGMYVKGAGGRSPPPDDEPPSPPPPPPHTRTPSLDLVTPDSGVEDVTPGSAADEPPPPPAAPAPVAPAAAAAPALPAAAAAAWRADSASSSESASPASPAADALGGLRHTRDKLKLDLPPSPHAPSPRHARVFSFALDKPRRPAPPAPPPAEPAEPAPPPQPEPTFSTFGKSPRAEPEPRAPRPLLLAPAPPPPPRDPKAEGTVLDSGDEDSGIESSSKATLEREPAPNVS